MPPNRHIDNIRGNTLEVHSLFHQKRILGSRCFVDFLCHIFINPGQCPENTLIFNATTFFSAFAGFSTEKPYNSLILHTLLFVRLHPSGPVWTILTKDSEPRRHKDANISVLGCYSLIWLISIQAGIIDLGLLTWLTTQICLQKWHWFEFAT